ELKFTGKDKVISRDILPEITQRLRFMEEVGLGGRPAAEIHRIVEAEKIDLIVMGTHGQSGLQLLLGSTANSVLHGVTCDVLAVRVKGGS
ncbi:MAG: universal stress protein, partial [Pseudomonadota bacterium]